MENRTNYLGSGAVPRAYPNRETGRKPTDIGGWCYIPFTDNVEEASKRLVKELFEASLPIATRDL
jgi:hypothetical protein